MDFTVDYRSISNLLPVERVADSKWDRFTNPDNDEILYSLVAKLYVTETLEIVAHKKFLDAMAEVVNRGAKRGHDYVVFATMQSDGWYIQARIDRHFISYEDVINE